MRTVADSGGTVCPALCSQHARILQFWPHADCCGFGHRLPPPGLPKRHSYLSHRMRPHCGFDNCLPSPGHEMALLPLWPPADCCGFGHRLPSPGVTKYKDPAILATCGPLRFRPPSALPCGHEQNVTPASLAACGLLITNLLLAECGPLRLPPPSALPYRHKMPLLPLWPHADHCGFG